LPPSSSDTRFTVCSLQDSDVGIKVQFANTSDRCVESMLCTVQPPSSDGTRFTVDGYCSLKRYCSKGHEESKVVYSAATQL
jgi:hypothetical protein